MPYEVSTPVFEGPFDLLLHLIASDQVDVYEVSLSRIVDGYLAELDRMERLDLDVATEFLLIAATLIELKTKRLLPGRDDTDLDEELQLYAERDTLLARLLECKTFKDAAAELERLARLAGRSHPRTAGLEERFIDVAPDILAGVTPSDLAAALVKALTPRPAPRVDLEHVAPIRASVRDALEELAAELPGAGRTTFRHLTGHHRERLEIIVRFLAVLELYKRGLVEIRQAGNFGELEIAWVGRAETDAGDLSTADLYD
ncbi:MAG: segregation/condensation protein A [Acidimicrobiia bacterium]|nr:segregation/condensation protein A [Acidimicrobiia bacterium]